MTRAALYLRVSTRDQAIRRVKDKQEQEEAKKASLKTQRESCEAYAKAQGWEVGELYEDAGVSGATDDRPALQQALTDARQGKYERLIYHKVDRFGRNMRDSLNLWDTFDKLGVGVVCVDPPLDTSTAFGRAMRNMLAVFAELERELIIERTAGGLQEAVERGMFVGGTPAYGYDTLDGSLVVNEAEAEVVHHIYHLYASGMTQAQVAERLNLEGVPTKKPPGKWHQGIVGRILISHIYLGEAYYGKTHNGDKKEGRKFAQKLNMNKEHWQRIPCPAIVSKAEWKGAEARARKNARDSKRPKDSFSPFLLHGLIGCKPCSGGMASHNKRDGRPGQVPSRLYYFCSRQHDGNGTCRPRPLVRADKLDADVFNRVADAFSEPQKVLEACQAHVERLEAAQPAHDELMAGLQRNLAEREKERDGYERQLAKGQITEDKAIKHFARVDKEIAGIQAEIDRQADIAVQQANVRDLQDKVFAIAEAVRNRRAEMTLEERKALVRALVDKVWVDADNKVEIECLVPGLLAARDGNLPAWAGGLPYGRFRLVAA